MLPTVLLSIQMKMQFKTEWKRNNFLKPLQKKLIVAWKQCQPYIDGELLWPPPSPAADSALLIILYTPASVDPPVVLVFLFPSSSKTWLIVVFSYPCSWSSCHSKCCCCCCCLCPSLHSNRFNSVVSLGWLLCPACYHGARSISCCWLFKFLLQLLYCVRSTLSYPLSPTFLPPHDQARPDPFAWEILHFRSQ